jgi:phytoene dehydrogenase-like protein
MEIGPVWIDDRPALLEGFEKIGVDPSTVPLVEIDPLLRYEFGDGRRLVLYRDLERAAAAVEDLFPGQGKGYRALMESYATLSRDSGPEATSLDVFAREFLSNEELRSVLYSFEGLHALEPQAIPAHEFPLARAHAHGAWVPAGGFRRLANSLAELARGCGVQFVMGARVNQLTVQSGAVVGVNLVGGLRLKAKAVLSTASAGSVFNEWMPKEIKSPMAPKILGMRLVAPPFLLQRSLERPAKDLPYLTILGRGERALDQDGAVVHVVNQTGLDPTLAPTGMGFVRILASLDYPAVGGSWGLRRKALGKAVAHRVDNVLGPSLEVAEEVNRFHDPELLSALLRLNSRSIYPAVTRWQTGEGRVGHRCTTPSSLYLAGSWSESGPAVGASMCGGIRTAELVLEDLGV